MEWGKKARASRSRRLCEVEGPTVQVAADRRAVVVVALVAIPRAVRLERHVPIRVGRVLERLAHARVPWVRPHRAAVHPHRLAERGARRHDDLLLQQLLVVHGAVLRPNRLGVRPVKVDDRPCIYFEVGWEKKRRRHAVSHKEPRTCGAAGQARSLARGRRIARRAPRPQRGAALAYRGGARRCQHGLLPQWRARTAGAAGQRSRGERPAQPCGASPGKSTAARRSRSRTHSRRCSSGP